MIRFRLCVIGLAAVLSFVSGCSLLRPADPAKNVTLPSLISRNMVLQAGMTVPIWGRGDTGGRVTVQVAGRRGSAVVKPDGSWRVNLRSLKSGGPFEMKITGAETITVKNVLVGEVWVGSGQSNMQWPVSRAKDAKAEIAAARYPRIRLFTVPRRPAMNPMTTMGGGWVECNPSTIPSFSAVAYYFGRELHKRNAVPVGLINCSWGGTNIETWMPREAFESDPAMRHVSRMADLAPTDMPAARRIFNNAMDRWEAASGVVDTGNEGVTLGWADRDFDVSAWKEMPIPGKWGQHGAAFYFDGAVWFRREVTVPAAWKGKDLELHLGAIDDFDTTYFNNVKVGAIGRETPASYAASREYTIPASCVKIGRNVIAVRVFDHYLDGGFAGGAPQQLKLFVKGNAKAESVPLAGTWRYKIERKIIPKASDFPKPSNPKIGGKTPAPMALYNGMIHPVIPYAIRGVLWYQGESNAGAGPAYTRMLSGMIRKWREAWGSRFAFLIVQLPNFMARSNFMTHGVWAEFREAQSDVQKVSRTGLAVTIDVGDGKDLHPKNKQDVGRRLALVALKVAYGKRIVHTGPVYRSMRIEGNRIRLRFDNVGGGIVCTGEKLVGFAIAGADRKFVWADAKIDGETVVVCSNKIAEPKYVRYAWANNPACNLYNKEGLPAAPFRTSRSDH